MTPTHWLYFGSLFGFGVLFIIFCAVTTHPHPLLIRHALFTVRDRHRLWIHLLDFFPEPKHPAGRH